MHPVVRHLLARKNMRVPIKDESKIALILFGGAMASIRGAGACIALKDMGLSNAFDEIYASSAGFCNASYLLTKNGKAGLSIYYEDLSGHKFINFFRPWKLADIDYMVSIMKDTKKLQIDEIAKSQTKLFFRVRNVTKKQDYFLNAHKYLPNSYFKLIKAATIAPYLYPGTVKFGADEYKDTFGKNSWIKIISEVIEKDLTDILIVYNSTRQYEYIHKKLNGRLDINCVLEIVPKKAWTLKRLETDPKKLKEACVQMGNLTMEVFGKEQKVII